MTLPVELVRAKEGVPVHHVSFCTPDLELSLRFYRDILGFAQVQRPDLGIPGAWLNRDGLELHLIVPPASERVARHETRSIYRNHVALRIADYAGVLKRLRDEGFDPIEGGFGMRQLFVTDPGGNMIEFIAT